MGDHQDRFAFCQLPDGLLQLLLVFGIHAGCSFIQNDDGCVLQNCPCNGDPLLFSAGEAGASFADRCLITVGQRHDKVMAAGFLCDCYDFILACVRSAKPDIVLDGVLKEIHILKYDGEILEKAAAGIFPHIPAAERDLSFLHIPETGDQTDQRGFSGAGGTNDGAGASLGYA